MASEGERRGGGGRVSTTLHWGIDIDIDIDTDRTVITFDYIVLRRDKQSVDQCKAVETSLLQASLNKCNMHLYHILWL